MVITRPEAKILWQEDWTVENMRGKDAYNYMMCFYWALQEKKMLTNPVESDNVADFLDPFYLAQKCGFPNQITNLAWYESVFSDIISEMESLNTYGYPQNVREYLGDEIEYTDRLVEKVETGEDHFSNYVAAEVIERMHIKWSENFSTYYDVSFEKGKHLSETIIKLKKAMNSFYSGKIYAISKFYYKATINGNYEWWRKNGGWTLIQNLNNTAEVNLGSYRVVGSADSNKNKQKGFYGGNPNDVYIQKITQSNNNYANTETNPAKWILGKSTGQKEYSADILFMDYLNESCNDKNGYLSTNILNTLIISDFKLGDTISYKSELYNGLGISALKDKADDPDDNSYEYTISNTINNTIGTSLDLYDTNKNLLDFSGSLDFYKENPAIT